MKKNIKMKKIPNKLAIKKYLKIIDKIENIRGTNNINWMNILRIAFIHSPDETKKIMKKINSHDHKIYNLLKKLQK